MVILEIIIFMFSFQGPSILYRILKRSIQQINSHFIEHNSEECTLSEEFCEIAQAVKDMKGERVLSLEAYMKKCYSGLSMHSVAKVLEKLTLFVSI